MVAALKAIKVPNVRWPGGCFADEYHWRNGIGPRDKRPATLNPNWGGVIEPNTFGTHEFMDFVQQIGAEAYLSINVGSGTPAEAADWLEYLTTSAAHARSAKERAANGHPEPYPVALFGIGNENWGCGGSMTPDYYVDQLKVYARYARNYNPRRTDAAHRRRARTARDTDYTEAVMKAWKNKTWAWDIEGISLHFYTVVKWPPAFKATGFGENEYATMLKDTLQHGRPAQHAQRHHGQVRSGEEDRAGGRRVGRVAGGDARAARRDSSSSRTASAMRSSPRSTSTSSRAMPIACACANIAQMVNVLQAMIFTDKEKMVLTPTYHVFKMYVPFQDATFVPVDSSAGDVQGRRHRAAARGCDRGARCRRKAVAGADQSRSQSRREHRCRGRRGRSQARAGRNAGRAARSTASTPSKRRARWCRSRSAPGRRERSCR